jgi:hypothetical protein
MLAAEASQNVRIGARPMRSTIPFPRGVRVPATHAASTFSIPTNGDSSSSFE